MFFHLDAILLMRAAKHDPERAAISRFHSVDRERDGQDQDAGKVVQQQRQQHRVVLPVGWERHSYGQDDEQREPAPASELAGVDSGGLSITTSLVGEEQCRPSCRY